MWDGIQSSLNSAEKTSQPDYILEQLISVWNYPIADIILFHKWSLVQKRKSYIELHGA